MTISKRIELKTAVDQELITLKNLLSDEASLSLMRLLDATDRFVHLTKHGNYPDVFNQLRSKLKERDESRDVEI